MMCPSRSAAGKSWVLWGFRGLVERSWLVLCADWTLCIMVALRFRENRSRRVTYPNAVSKGVVYLSEDRKEDGLFPRLSVRLNLLASLLPFQSKAGIYSPGKDGAVVRRYLDELNIVAASPDTDVGTLSGGNQQKVLLGKCLATGPKVFASGRTNPWRRRGGEDEDP